MYFYLNYEDFQYKVKNSSQREISVAGQGTDIIL